MSETILARIKDLFYIAVIACAVIMYFANIEAKGVVRDLKIENLALEVDTILAMLEKDDSKDDAVEARLESAETRMTLIEMREKMRHGQ